MSRKARSVQKVDYGLDDREVGVRFRQEAKGVFLVPKAQTRSRDNSTSYPICKGEAL
jgi:hypothetical protein